MAESDLGQLVDLLKTEVKKLKLLQAELDSCSSATLVPTDDVTRTVLRNKCLKLKAELLQLESESCEGLPVNKRLQVALAKRRLQEEVSGLKDLLESLRSKRGQLTEKNGQLKVLIEKQEKMLQIVKSEHEKDGISVSEDDENNGAEVDTCEIKLKQELLKVAKLKDLRLSQLREFLNEHFPSPSEDIIADVSHEDLFDFSEKQGTKSLSAIIQLLVNKYLADPHDFWVTIDSTMWLPYVELLLRSRIAVRNPNNASQIRLEKCWE